MRSLEWKPALYFLGETKEHTNLAGFDLIYLAFKGYYEADFQGFDLEFGQSIKHYLILWNRRFLF